MWRASGYVRCTRGTIRVADRPTFYNESLSELRKFIFDGMPVRGILVRLDDAWREIQARRVSATEGAFAPPVMQVLGELSAAAVLMQASIRFDGTLILQVFGDGPLKLAVAEVQADLSLRATAKVLGEVTSDATLAQLVNRSHKGRCAVTLDPRERRSGQQPYQGVVSLEGGRDSDRVADIMQRYMRQSEQLDTTLVLACSPQMAAGLMIQRLPVQGEHNLAAGRLTDDTEVQEDYRRIAMLAASLSPQELLAWDAPTLLRKLFWQEPCRPLEPEPLARPPRFACSCSRERVSAMIRGLGADEAEDILRERGEIEVGCEFCGAQYRYDAVDAARIFMPGQDQPPASEGLQ